MRIEIHIYGKNSVFFAVHKKRYQVVYVKDGRYSRWLGIFRQQRRVKD